MLDNDQFASPLQYDLENIQEVKVDGISNNVLCNTYEDTSMTPRFIRLREQPDGACAIVSWLVVQLRQSNLKVF